MSVTINKDGYGQLEFNHLPAQRTGRIHAQWPLDSSIATLENGSFLKYNPTKGTLGLDGTGEWLLVANEIKLYDPRKQQLKDFAVIAADYMDGEVVPRVYRVASGAIFTTNNVVAASYKKGDELAVNASGLLAAKGSNTAEYTVVDETTMPDGQYAVKVMKL